MIIQPPATRHDRVASDCGVEDMNTFLRQYARQNASRDFGVTYVAVADAGAGRIEGYYTLASGAVAFQTMPQERVPHYPIPVVHLGRLAVDRGSQGQGVGRTLLLDALRPTTLIAREIGVFAVEVRALDERARCFYEKYGFTPLADDPLHLYLTLKTVRDLGL